MEIVINGLKYKLKSFLIDYEVAIDGPKLWDWSCYQSDVVPLSPTPP